MNSLIKEQTEGTYMHDPVLWIMAVCSAYVLSATVPNWLNYSDVVTAVEMLEENILLVTHWKL